MKIVSVAEMRAIETASAAAGISERVMMETAGREMARAIDAFIRESFAPSAVRRIAVVAGRGNNGGDGIVIGEALRERYPVVIYALAAPEEMREPAQSVGRAAELTVRPSPEGGEFLPGDLIVDAVAGIGVEAPLTGRPREWVEAINRAGCPVAAVDVPSGLDADTGEGDPVVTATLTLAAGAFKPGHFRNPAVGRLGLASIGAPREALAKAESSGEAMTAAETAAFFTPRAADAFKNRTGQVLVVAGSAAYGGAALLATLGALAGGAGMVHALTPPGALAGRHWPASVILHSHPGAILSGADAEALRAAAARVDAIVAGPGLGTDPATGQLLAELFRLDLPTVADADALNLLSRHPEWLYARRSPLILTPHPGEAARLAGDAATERSKLARELAGRYRATVILKGYQSVIADAEYLVINTSGAPTLATAGSGDVLAGLAGALLASSPDKPFACAAAACWLHGRAGELSQRGRATVADDLPELIVRAGREITWRF